ncbi:MAG: radical SAM protein [Chlorobiaceae bacterium]|nr:radical SAM protein [Chlorobiaceae bacterium]
MKPVIANHSSFNEASRHQFGRIHLPVAPKCNIQCNYCNRQYDCVHENPPGITSRVLAPQQALQYLDQAMALSPHITTVAITGPGDPFANPDATMETLRLVREKYPWISLCIATNGLAILPWIDTLAALQVNHVTMTINAVDPEIGAEIYAWVQYKKKMYRDLNAAKLLIKKQLEALKRLKEAGFSVKVNSIIIPGINDIHVITVASKVAELGADILHYLPFYNTKEIVFENLTEPSAEMVREIQHATSKFIPQMKHYLWSMAHAEEMQLKPAETAALPEKTPVYRPYIAVSSLEGVMINQHLGESERFLIYTMDATGKCTLVNARKAPQAGGGEQRWNELAETLSDCRTILVSGAGEAPKKVLNRHGIEVIVIEGVIKEIVVGIFSGQDLQELIRKSQIHAGSSNCRGTGKKCG